MFYSVFLFLPNNFDISNATAMPVDDSRDIDYNLPICYLSDFNRNPVKSRTSNNYKKKMI